VPGNGISKVAKRYINNKEFFKALESMYISDLIHEVRITVKMKDTMNLLTFRELSEGEQQLLTVLGLLKFTKESESLFLLDEPDTHLNPAWKLEYLSLIENVVGIFDKSHIIICTHDPLIIGGLLRSQVQIFEKEKNGQIVARPPEIDPKGMGVSALLTSELFGLKTTLDLDTQTKVDRKRGLSLKPVLTPEENKELIDLADELGSLDFTRTIRDPLYDKFVRAMMSRKEFQKPILTPTERREQEKMAREIIDEILAEETK
jgi:energy-coupling factor transporter ATP-binding protein EcfA2